MKMPTQESFLKDVKNHVMDILYENKYGRCVRFGEPDSKVMEFYLVSTPDVMLYYGDMGTYCFKRHGTGDMFNFFNNKFIRPYYWGEKLVSQSMWGGFREFNEEIFKEILTEVLQEELSHSDYNYDYRIQIYKKFKEMFLNKEIKNLNQAEELMQKWNRDQPDLDFDICEDYTCHTPNFIWCCYALNWACKRLKNV